MKAPPECARCSGKGLEGDSYDGRKPGYVSPTVEYGKLKMTDDRGKVWPVDRDATAESAIERLEAKRDQFHFEVDLRIDELIAGVRRWDAGRPYPEEPVSERDLPESAMFEKWHVSKARKCAEFMRPLLATWQYAQEVKRKADAEGFKPNTIERARNLLYVEIENRDGRSYWRLPDTSDIRTSDDTASEVGSSEAAEDRRPAEHEALRKMWRLRRANAGG